MSEKAPFMVFSGTNSRYLAEKICASLDCPLGNMNITHFADGEFAVSYEESIRGAHVFLVQSTFPNSDNLMESGAVVTQHFPRILAGIILLPILT